MSAPVPWRPSGTVAAVARARSSAAGPVSERLHQAGHDAHAAHAVGRQIERDGAREGLDTALGGVVGDHPAVRAARAAARGVDDHAGALLDHVACRTRRAQEVPLEVRVEHEVPGRLVDFEEVLDGRPDDGGVVDEDVQAPEALEAGVERPLDVRRVGDVALDAQTALAECRRRARARARRRSRRWRRARPRARSARRSRVRARARRP